MSSYMVFCCPLEYYDTSLLHTHAHTRTLHRGVPQNSPPRKHVQHFDISYTGMIHLEVWYLSVCIF